MSISKKFVIIDEIMDQLEAAKSGVVPGSVSQSVVSGIQNVPSTIIQGKMEDSSASCYTTFPLSPIVKNCCLDKTYLNFEFDVTHSCSIELASAASANEVYEMPYHFGMKATPTMFNQIQVLIENTSLWSTVYQREEAIMAYNSLPETEVRGNNQYASVEKMQQCKYSPMKRVVVRFPYADFDATHKKCTKDVTIHFKATVDLNRITPLLSNLHYTTPHMGNLRLKVFLQQFEKCLFFCPDYNYIPFQNLAINYPACSVNTEGWDTLTAAKIKAGVDAAVDAVMANAAVTSPTNGIPAQNQYWTFYPLSMYAKQEILASAIPFYATVTNTSTHNKGIVLVAKVTLGDPSTAVDGKIPPFMTFNTGIAEIVQTNFEIKSEEYERLTNYFASTGSIIIPTQTYSTSVFNNSNITKDNWNSSMVGNVGGYNINFISVFFHPDNSPCYFNNEFLTGIQLLLDGRTVNAISYDYMNDKCIVDMTQAIIDTDHEEINHDYMDSLTFLNETDDGNYIKESAHTLYGDGSLTSSINKAALRNPACSMYNFSTNLPDAFHSGACILENSNRQAVIRFLSNKNSARPVIKDDRTKFPLYIDSYNAAAINARSGGTTAGFSCFCDACIVLNFDASRNKAFDGQLSWSAPYIE